MRFWLREAWPGTMPVSAHKGTLRNIHVDPASAGDHAGGAGFIGSEAIATTVPLTALHLVRGEGFLTSRAADCGLECFVPKSLLYVPKRPLYAH